MSYARLSKRSFSFRSFTGLAVSEFDVIAKDIESKYDEHERKRLSRRKRERKVGAGRPFKLKVKERFLILLVYYRLYITYTLSGLPNRRYQDQRTRERERAITLAKRRNILLSRHNIW